MVKSPLTAKIPPFLVEPLASSGDGAEKAVLVLEHLSELIAVTADHEATSLVPVTRHATFTAGREVDVLGVALLTGCFGSVHQTISDAALSVFLVHHYIFDPVLSTHQDVRGDEKDDSDDSLAVEGSEHTGSAPQYLSYSPHRERRSALRQLREQMVEIVHVLAGNPPTRQLPVGDVLHGMQIAP